MDQAVRDEIVKTKRALGAGSPALKDAFRRAEDRIRRESDIVQKEVAAGRSPLPELQFSVVKDGRVAEGARNEIRKRGFAVIRGVFPVAQAQEWNEELGRYIEDNHYYEKAQKKGSLDNYFSQLDAARPQIFGIYWSKPQVQA